MHYRQTVLFLIPNIADSGSYCCFDSPRPAGYEFSRELFRKRTGLAFDQFAPAETATDFAFSFYSTVNVYHVCCNTNNKQGLGLNEMIQYVIDQTWKAPSAWQSRRIDTNTNRTGIAYLFFAASVMKQFICSGIVLRQLDELKKFIGTTAENINQHNLYRSFATGTWTNENSEGRKTNHVSLGNSLPEHR